jgi:putative transposase
MPDHVHLLLTPGPDCTLERAIQLIKGAYSHALGSVIGRKSEIWQRGFTDHRIRNAADFAAHREYIHKNPVARHIVEDAAKYPYCSAFSACELDPWPSAAKAGILQEEQSARVELVPFPDHF